MQPIPWPVFVESLLVILAVVSLLGMLLLVAELYWNGRTVRRLSDTPPLDDTAPLPRVSVVIPARNEADTVEPALRSVLALDYPNLDIIAINDRSEDATGAVLDRLAQTNPALRVIHIATLPDGWLGKNHALHTGAQQAQGDWILFTDADIVFEPSTLRRAMGYLRAHPDIAHLACLPEAKMHGFWLNLFMGGFMIFFALYARPWKARDPHAPQAIGVGAFNFIRRPVYDAIGTFEAIAMRPDDDMKLGKLVKQHGFRQDVLNGYGHIQVAWYSSLPHMIGGLMKNAFAGLDYRLDVVLAGCAGQLLMFVWPVLALGMTSGLLWWLNLTLVGLMLLIGWNNARHFQLPRSTVFSLPFAACIIVYILLRASLGTLSQGGIYWRDTFYPLEQLRKNRL